MTDRDLSRATAVTRGWNGYGIAPWPRAGEEDGEKLDSDDVGQLGIYAGQLKEQSRSSHQRQDVVGRDVVQQVLKNNREAMLFSRF